MANLFKKAAVFTDIHFGLKSNSLQHNLDCSEFVEWFIQKAKEEGCETCLFLGDYNHHRASINIHTLQFGLRALERLNESFNHVYFIPGNHDLYYRDKRDVHSVEWARHLPNVTIVNEWFNQGDVVIAPWLVQDDYKKLMKMSGKYLFAHLELPHFYMNAMVEMPDHGEINDNHVSNFEQVFSGHFHKRQARKNIWYIGNAFPHNYADAGDDARGMMVLEWGKDPEFHSWPNQPLFRVYKLSEILDNPNGLLLPRSHIRVHLDIDISYEEANFLREKFIPEHELREMALIPMKLDQVALDLAPGELKFESVDQIIIDQISNIESQFYDPKLLLDIYRNL
jgi:UDP-2,3-diacylglucosamine pyrophosphatase LpxH